MSDSVGAAAVGAVAIAPSNPNVVWMGTGDQANARSSYSGKGVFKSTDAGATWQFMGLPDSHHIARIVIHPKNPDVVYVAAIGHLFSKNAERGVFRTMDGGKTWKKVLFVNDGVGAIDLVINRKTPATLYAAMYDKDRRPWQIVESGPESAIYRTDDGGDKWQKLGGGLPAGKIGRIGLDIYQKNPLILYALLENQNPKPGAPARDVNAISPLAAGIIGNEMYRTDDGGKTWRKVTDVNVAGGKAPYSFNQMRINPHDDKTVIVTSDAMFISRDGGKTWSSDFFRGVFGDFRSMWWDPDDKDRIILGSDGGVNVSVDGGKTGDYFPNMGVGEVYAIGVDMDDPYNVYGGLQDHDSWKGPSNGPTGRITLENWVDGRPRRRHVQRRRSDRQPLGLQHARAEPDGAHGPEDRRAHEHRPVAPRRPAAAALQLDRADRAVAAQPADRLRRRAGALPLAQPRRHVGGDQPRSHDQRSVEDRPQRALLHDHLDLRVAAQGRHHLGRDRRRQGAAHAEPRRRVDRPHAGADRGRRARRSLGQPRVRLAARRGDGVRLEERVPQRRLRAVPVQDDRQRQDLDGDQGQPARTPRSTSSCRIAGTRISSSSGTTSACSCRSTAAAAGRRSRPTCRPSPSTT